MSGDKDLAAHVPTPGRARASGNQIRLMFGRLEVEGDRLIRTGMYGRREVWRLVSGTGASAIYEKLGED